MKSGAGRQIRLAVGMAKEEMAVYLSLESLFLFFFHVFMYIFVCVQACIYTLTPAPAKQAVYYLVGC